jgi:hypothetical protein
MKDFFETAKDILQIERTLDVSFNAAETIERHRNLARQSLGDLTLLPFQQGEFQDMMKRLDANLREIAGLPAPADVKAFRDGCARDHITGEMQP